MKHKLAFLALLSSTIASAEGGTFPNISRSWHRVPVAMEVMALRQLSVGMPKRQIRHLIGVPHFNEGIGAKVWNYWFVSPAQENCQLRIRFDQNTRAASIEWNMDSCKRAVDGNSST